MRTDKQDEFGIDYAALTDNELGLLSRYAQDTAIRCRAASELDKRRPEAAKQAADCLGEVIEAVERWGFIRLVQAVSDFVDGRADHAWDNGEPSVRAWREVADTYSKAARQAHQRLRKYEALIVSQEAMERAARAVNLDWEPREPSVCGQ